MATETLRCTVCGYAGDIKGCVHQGSWHSSVSACSARCAWKLGWSNLGLQHWSCCFATEPTGMCPKLAHTFEPSEEAGVASAFSSDSTVFGKSDCPRYVVNLDEKPEARWTAIVEAYKDRLPAALELVDQILGAGFVAGAADTVLAGLTKSGRVFYGKELKGIAKVAYEAFAACTSIVCDTPADANLEADGEEHLSLLPFHIRTMDWEMEALQELTLEVEFVRDGKPVFIATTWPGYVGVLTGMRSHCFGVSVNYRRTLRGSENMVKGVLENLYRGLAMCWPVSFLVREALDVRYSPSVCGYQETCHTFEEAVSALTASELMAPAYIIVSGAKAGEGVVISRERKGECKLPMLSLGYLSSLHCAGEIKRKPRKHPAGPTRHGALVQPNMDHWRGRVHPQTDYALDSDSEPRPPEVGQADDSGDWQDICSSRERRAVAKAAIDELVREGGRVRGVELWQLVSTGPCRAEDTVYTVAMSAGRGEYCTRKRVTAAQKREGEARWGKLARRVGAEVRRALREQRERDGPGGGLVVAPTTRRQ